MRNLTLVLLALSSLFCCSHGWALVLVQDGQPQVSIILPSTPQPWELAAAQDLRSYVQQMSGALLPIVQTNTPPTSGTKYGVFAVLENLGCRFYSAMPDGEVIPEKGTLTVSALPLINKPDSMRRDMSFANPVCDNFAPGRWEA